MEVYKRHYLEISIHALLAESDRYDNYNLHCTEISIHALLAESDLHNRVALIPHQQFLSTLSLRRATSDLVIASDIIHFYPRSPCGERLRYYHYRPHLGYFYPRSPCGERLIFTARQATVGVFLSTLSLRRATAPQDRTMGSRQISIHALLAESDTFIVYSITDKCISIHALLAESDHVSVECVEVNKISIHALLAESDPVKIKPVLISTKFLSTLSLRRATVHRQRY